MFQACRSGAVALIFFRRYKRSDWHFCACAINVKSSMCSERTKQSSKIDPRETSMCSERTKQSSKIDPREKTLGIRSQKNTSRFEDNFIQNSSDFTFSNSTHYNYVTNFSIDLELYYLVQSILVCIKFVSLEYLCIWSNKFQSAFGPGNLWLIESD